MKRPTKKRRAYFRVLKTTGKAAIKAKGIEVIDPYKALKAAGFSAVHFAHDGHWTPLGHEVAASAVAEWLRGQGIGG